jgi:glutathione synthase/RimK-type ligase-like ATP-grasp enzyme
MKKIAIVSATMALERDADLQPLVAALASTGLEAEPVCWDDPEAAWTDYAMAVVRSTWDYVSRRDAFVAWAERTASLTRLENPAGVLRWNTDKRYLRDLEQKGVPEIPTHWMPPGKSTEWTFEGDVVVKPAVSAGSMDTERYAPSRRGEALAHVQRLQAAGRVAMVQPLIPSVRKRGETDLVFLDGRFSHAFRKGSMLEDGTKVVGGLYREERIDACTPSAAELRVAEAALAGAPADLLYARVDVVETPDGIRVLELEATEPALHLGLSSGSVDRLAAGIAQRLKR